MKKEITVTKNEENERIDSFLAKRCPEYSRSYFSNLLKEGGVVVNRKVVRPSYLVNAGDIISITFAEQMGDSEVVPQEISLAILYEDRDVIVIDKKPGIAVHPGAGNKTGTIVNALVNYFPKIKEAVFVRGNQTSEIRPGIVHRLDKDTSGVMIIAKNDKAMHSLSRQIQHRDIRKIYLALCYGWPKEDKGRLINYLGRHPRNRKMITDLGKEKGKEAISDYEVKKYFRYGKSEISLIQFRIFTGRTHQIRAQSKIIGHPVLGDTVYGNKDSILVSKILGIRRQLLHALELIITLPGDSKPTHFIAPLPTDFKKSNGQAG